MPGDSQANQSITLARIAAALEAPLEGDGTLVVEAISHPSAIGSDATLALAVDDKAWAALAGSTARMAIVPRGADISGLDLDGVLRFDRSRWALAVVTGLLARRPCHHAGIHPGAAIDGTARIGAGVSVGAFAVVGPGAEIGAGSVLGPGTVVGQGTVLGRDCFLHAGVYLADGVCLGDRVEIHANSVIGADGFGYATPEAGSVETAKATGRVGARNVGLRKIHSLGTVTIADDVEIGAGTTIDKGTFGATRIGRGTKIDNQVQIGHNVEIGEDCLIVSQVGLAGSARVGDRVVLAGKVGIADHVHIGDDAVVAAGSGVATTVPQGQLFIGYPAQPRDRMFAELKALRGLPRLMEKVSRLGKDVAALKAGEGTAP